MKHWKRTLTCKFLREAVIKAESTLSRTEEIPTEQIAVYSYQAPDIANFVSLQVPIDLDYMIKLVGGLPVHWIVMNNKSCGMRLCISNSRFINVV